MGYEASYNRHSRLETEQATDTELPSCYSAPESVDAWRHQRMLEMLDPLIRTLLHLYAGCRMLSAPECNDIDPIPVVGAKCGRAF